jgi:hypothetical protein
MKAPCEEDKGVSPQENALTLRIIGWQLLALNAIPILFIWDGWRVGSEMWTWWFLAEGFLGSALVLAGHLWEATFPTAVAAVTASPATAADAHRKAA